MSASRNTDALANQEDGGSGEFSSRVPPSEPLMTSGHQPGKLVGNDAAPEFTAQTLPPGTAPPSRTFQPNNNNNPSEIPPEATTAAADTLGGSTSADVHDGLGHPGSGQSSAELRHDGQSHRKNPGASLEGVGAEGVRQSGIDAHDPAHANQRALGKDEAVVGRGEVLGAHEREPVGAEEVAAERD